MGKKFEEYTESGYIVGEEDDPESDNIQMAIQQNDSDDTSCAIPQDEDEDEDDPEGAEGDEEAEDDVNENDESSFARKPSTAGKQKKEVETAEV